MSSKGRKEVELDEFYPTDPRVVRSLLESDLVQLPSGIWIEPCAGTGRIVSAVNEYRNVDWIMCELNESFSTYLEPLRSPGDTIIPYGDFVHRNWKWPYADVLIMNPPFSFTFQFVTAAGDRAAWVVCIQRQGWFGTQERSPWLRDHCPDIFQLPWRASFRPDGKTDSCEYCWFIWPPGAITKGRREGRLAMLDWPKTGQQQLF